MINNFSRDLIKGRITETVFEQMFGEAGDYTIIPFGYEKLVPELARQSKFSKSENAKKVIKNISDSPDYAIIFPDKKTIFLVEVKFCSRLIPGDIVKIAKDQIKRWNPSWIFVASFDGFYLGECSRIIKYGDIPELKLSIVKSVLQEKYLKLIREFEKSS